MTVKAAFIFLPAVLALAAAAEAATLTRRLEKSLPLPAGQVVRLTHRYGSILARPADTETLRVSAAAIVKGNDRRQAAEFLTGIELSLASWEDTVFVAVLYPGLVTPSSEFSYEVDLTLLVPPGVRFEAANAFGDMELYGITGGSSVTNRYGNVDFRDCRDVEVTVSHGDVRVAECSGGLGINSSYGNVYLDDVADQVAVDSRYGDVSGQQLDGDVTISNVLGSIATEGGRGKWCLVSRYGEVAARLDDSTMTKLDVVAELARVRLLLPHVLPFRIEGRVSDGEIGTSYPLQTGNRDGQCRVSGAQGRGGPHIVFTGAWADFFIDPDTTGEPAN